jgi:hypothetical protein
VLHLVSITAVALFGLALSLQPAVSQSNPSKSDGSQAASSDQGQQGQSANEVVRNGVQHELKAEKADHSHWMYRLEIHENGHDDVKEVVETKDGNLERLVMRDGQPLSPDEQKAEDQKMDKFIHDPGAQQKQRRDLDQDEQKTQQLLGMLPNALTFKEEEHTGDTAKFSFTPNESFHPPSREARVFHEMEGQLVLNTREQRLVEFSGHLIHPVEFGGGLLGHLDQGGTFDVRQIEVAPGIWDIELLKVNMNGKALFFKTISVHQDEKHSDFHRVPDSTTLSQAEDLVKKARPEQPSEHAEQ